ncbi:hypothetical protein GC174_16415 [bacterium]|nr:hypothetical protein [bacterium]
MTETHQGRSLEVGKEPPEPGARQEPPKKQEPAGNPRGRPTCREGAARAGDRATVPRGNGKHRAPEGATNLPGSDRVSRTPPPEGGEDKLETTDLRTKRTTAD